MPAEADAEKVVNLAFEIIGGRPDGNHRVQHWRICVQAYFQSHPFFSWNRKQVINDFEARLLGKPVNAGQVGKEIEWALRIVAQQSTNLANRRALDANRHFVTIEFDSFNC